MSKSSNAKHGESIAERVFKLTEPAVSALGLTLWDVEFKKEGSEWYLTLYIDKEQGVTIDDCEAVSRAVDPLLDKADIIDHSYRLEVSSLGLDRPLKLKKDFDRFMGRRVEVRFFRPLDSGEKQVEGRLLSHDDGIVTIQTDSGNRIIFKQSDAALIRLCIDF